MRKTKIFYSSLAVAAACLALVSCGKKKAKYDVTISPDGVKLAIQTNHYKIDYDSLTNGKITFYSVEYANDGDNYLVDENGDYYTKTISLGSMFVPGGSKIDYLPTPKRDGYKFVGWYVDEGCGTEFYYKTMPDSASLVAHARWELDQDTIYVSPEGSPFADGKKPNTPMSLYEASRVYKPGCTIEMADGTYSLSKTLFFGNDGTRNAITKINGNNAIIDYAKQPEADSSYGIKLCGDYTYINDLTIMNAGDNGILVGSSNNKIENCVFTKCHDTGLQIARYAESVQPFLDQWPSNNLILNCTSYNNCDNSGEDADGFAAKLTVGEGNVFDGCMAYWNIDDGWDLYAKTDSGRIGTVTLRNCVAFGNGHRLEGSSVYDKFSGDGNGFKLGGSAVKGEVIVDNCIAAYNFAHGFTDNSNPGVISISNCTAINNGQFSNKTYDNINLNRDALIDNKNYYSGILSYYDNASKNTYSEKSDDFNGSIENSILYQDNKPYKATGSVSAQSGYSFVTSKNVAETNNTSIVDATNPEKLIKDLATTNFHKKLRNEDGSINLKSYWKTDATKLSGFNVGADLSKSSYDDYKHSDLIALDPKVKDAEESVICAYNALNLAINNTAIYNDIYLPTTLLGTEVSWTSSNTNAITISTYVLGDENGQKYVYGVLAPRLDQDTEVTLTATIKVGKVTKTKEFKVTVQGLDPRVGTVSGIDDVTVLNNETLPDINTYVVKDYVSTSLTLEDTKDYTTSIVIKYSNEYYAVPKDGSYSTPVQALSKDNCGTYKITYTFHINGYQDTVVDRYITIVNSQETYKVTSAQTSLGYIIDDVVTLNINSNYQGGTAYAITSSENINVATLTPQDIKNGTISGAISAVATKVIDSRDFTLATPLNENYVQNTSAYSYVVIENANGFGAIYKTSEIYPTENITTAAQLHDALNLKANRGKAYKLANDIDCEGATWTQNATSNDSKSDHYSIFTGYFDGNGHKISNLNIIVDKVEGGGLFYKADKQAIIKNLALEEVFVNASVGDENHKKTAILVGDVKGGVTIENIYILNCGVKSYERVAGIVGQYSGSSEASTTTIRNVVITSTKSGEKYSISASYTSSGSDGKITSAGGKYVGGILAHCQYDGYGEGSSLVIENCYVNMNLIASNQFSAGILGRIDAKKGSTTIKNCVFAGEISSSSSYAAGIMAGRSSGQKVQIINCVSRGLLTASSGVGATVSQQMCNKQTIGTEKYYTINDNIVEFTNCYWPIPTYDPENEKGLTEEEHIAAETLKKNYYGTPVYSSKLTDQSWYESIGFDFTNIFVFNKGEFKLQYFNKN